MHGPEFGRYAVHIFYSVCDAKIDGTVEWMDGHGLAPVIRDALGLGH